MTARPRYDELDDEGVTFDELFDYFADLGDAVEATP